MSEKQKSKTVVPDYNHAKHRHILMGLDTTHNAWHGPYSHFARWREWLAEQIGIPDLNVMEGFSSDFKTFGTRKWDSLPPDDLHILLTHSDCDGEISPQDCAKIAARLADILEKLPVNHKWYYETKTFHKGCLLAAKRNEQIEFH